MHYHFKVHKEGRSHWAECVELRGCYTQGVSMEGLQKNMKEALNLFLDEPAESKLVLPLPKQMVKGKNIVRISVEPRIALAFCLRQLRLSHHMTQKEVANKMGFKNLYSYQRLESSKTANPEFSTLLQIKKVFPEFDVDELLSA
jgi:antitoxin HicB